MSDALYPITKGLMMQKQVNLLTDNIVVVLLDTALYTYSANHSILDDIPSGAIVATSGTLANRTITANVFDADDITFTSVTGASVEAVAIVQDTGNSATSLLIAYLDEDSSGLPLTPSGGDVSITWSNGANKIFSL